MTQSIFNKESILTFFQYADRKDKSDRVFNEIQKRNATLNNRNSCNKCGTVLEIYYNLEETKLPK
jgi:hypothetical protein